MSDGHKDGMGKGKTVQQLMALHGGFKKDHAAMQQRVMENETSATSSETTATDSGKNSPEPDGEGSDPKMNGGEGQPWLPSPSEVLKAPPEAAMAALNLATDNGGGNQVHIE